MASASAAARLIPAAEYSVVVSKGERPSHHRLGRTCARQVITPMPASVADPIRPNKRGRSSTPGGLAVTMTHALHSSGITGDDGAMVYGGEAGGYVMHFPDGRNAYFAGDTDVFAEMSYLQELHAPSLAFLPIGDLFTMSPRGAAIACRLLGCREVIPMHFGTFPPLIGTPAELASLTSCKATELTPGVAYNW